MQILLLLILFFAGRTSLATTINVGTCNESDVATAVSGAVNGDIVSIQSGSCTWTTQLDLAGKAITLTSSVKIYTDSSGSPGTQVGSNVTLTGSSVGAAEGDIVLSGFGASLTAGASYWIVAYSALDASNYYMWAYVAAAACSPQIVKNSSDGTSWSTTTSGNSLKYTIP